MENPDGDELSYRLAFREENEAVWRPLGGPDPLTKTEYDWNTEGLPDGTYVVTVTASDERSEPRERALDTTFTSAPILVDNRKPEVVGLAAQATRSSRAARATTRARSSAMEYAIDGGEWQILSPADGISDDLVESFTVKLPAAGARAARGHGARLGQRRQRRRRGDHGQVAGQMTAAGATTRPGCRPRPRSSRSRSACCRTSARSSTARTRARRRSSTRPGRSTGCCARRSGWA